MGSADSGSAGSDLGGGIGSGIGGFIGYLLGGEDRQKALDNIRAGRDVWTGIDPSVRAQAEQVVDQGPSAFEQVSVDPTARNAQVRAYQQLGQLGMNGGMDAQSQARLSQAMDQTSSADTANRQALAQQYAAMGRAGGLGGYAAQLSGQQGAAHANAMAGVQAAGDASARGMQALGQSGQLAGQVRGQDYQQQSDLASARDAVAAHNAANRQSVYGRNADRDLQAQQATRGNQLARARGLSGTYDQESQYWDENGKKKQRIGTGLGESIGAGAGALVGKYG